MKNLLLIIIAILLSTLSFAQSASSLYGITSAGGDDGAGVIFHHNSATGEQIVDYSFPVSVDGANPIADLTDGGNGKFYGMTSKGGGYSLGIIFEWDPSTNVYTKKIDFDLIEKGSSPSGSLTLFDGKFYGMTAYGGINGKGVIFEWNPSTNIFTKKIDFNGIDRGSIPKGSLTLKDGKFYGMTSNGGTFDKGVIFEWDPSTNNFTNKFSLIDSSGSQPVGSLTLKDDTFYGITYSGGANFSGVLFEWDPTTNIFTKKIDFNGTEKGRNPRGSLTLKNEKFYGMAGGGIFGDGVIFEWDPVTAIFTKMIDFDGSNNGSVPIGTLTLFDEKFYGMTMLGGSGGDILGGGVVFEWDPVTNIFSKKIDFDGTSNGLSPHGSFTLMNGKLYAMTYSGGKGDQGIIFGWDPITNIFSKNIDLFYAPLGSMPEGNLALYNGNFYGMTRSGGEMGKGVIFEWNPSSAIYSRKISFDSDSLGFNPEGYLNLKDGKFYGMTPYGGKNGDGVIFEWDPVNNIYNKKIDFYDTVTGRNPFGSLALSGGKFYGVTESGSTNGGGVIFEWDPSTNAFTKKIDLNEEDNAYGYLTLKDGKFYGMTYWGGVNFCGSIFEWDPATNIYIKKIDFVNAERGKHPYGSLTQYSDKFYGMTTQGGIYDKGTIFEWDPTTNAFSKLINFDGNEKGEQPFGSITIMGGKLYGMTYKGGISGAGVYFVMDPTTATFIKLHDFIGPDGSSPAFTQFTEYSTNVGVLENYNSTDIFPNPTTGILQINSPFIISKVLVYNSLGVCVKNIEIKQTRLTIDLSNQPKGIYTIELNINNKITTWNIIVI